MSRENVEVVRRYYEAWNAYALAAIGDLCDPDIVVHHVEGWPEPGPSVGREAALHLVEQLREAWDGDTLNPVGDFIEAGDKVIVRDVWHGTGRGPEADLEFTRVFTLRKGRIRSIEIFWDHGEALEAVGLSA
jgi:ketosteroid isomerase-like protein